MTTTSIQITDDWQTFNPRLFLESWHRQVTPEHTATLDFLRRSYQTAAPGARVIDFCCGPVVYQYLAAATRVAEIHACDLLPANLTEIRQWRDGAPEAFGWQPIVGEALRLEGRPAAPDDCAERERLARSKVTRLLACDIRHAHPLGGPVARRYDIVSHCYGADVVAGTVEEWQRYVANCCSVLKPGGTLLMTLIKEATWWPNGDQILPALALNERHVEAALLAIGFDGATIELEAHDVEDASAAGYSHVIFARARLAAPGSKEEPWPAADLSPR
ncbi:MAG TPA: guanitoxin biosynthesis pre-guanitoxin forming N-methyltransferase GntF [Herpetosiphonaceae bacterium]